MSKEKIDICRTDTEKIETVKNTREAIREYVENLPDSEHVLAVIDLTGGYEAICVREFYTAGFKVDDGQARFAGGTCNDAETALVANRSRGDITARSLRTSASLQFM